MWSNLATAMPLSRSLPSSSTISSSLFPSSSTLLAIVIWISSLSSMTIISGVSACQSHLECPYNQFCTVGLYCDLCLHCNDDAVTGNDWVGDRVDTFDGAACPEQCRCYSHQQCAIVAGDRPYDSYYTTGFFCALYGGGGGANNDGDFSNSGGEVNRTEGISVCQSCQELYDLGIYAPPYDDLTFLTDNNTDNSSNTIIVRNSPASSSSCPDIPCLCATTSDCPEDHYCASDLQHYVADGSYILGPNGPRLDNESMGPCHGYCVHCSHGCVDDFVVSYDQANETVSWTCQDVCNATYIQCNTHDECQNSDHHIDLTDDDYLYEGEPNTRWCSSNRQCNRCSWGCALNFSSTTSTDFYDPDQLFPSIDGMCPSGCCGWGVSMHPYWTYDSPGVVSPCGATLDTEIIATYLVAYSSFRLPTMDEFLMSGQPCSVEEVEYWEQPSSQSTNENGTTTSNLTSATGEHDIPLPRRATRVDCSTVAYLTCLQYPAAVAILMKRNNTVEEYEYIIDPVMVRNGYNCNSYQNAATQYNGIPTRGIIFIVAVSSVAVVAAVILSKAGVCKTSNNQLRGGNNNINVSTFSSLPTAIPVSTFLSAGPPLPPKAQPPSESAVVVIPTNLNSSSSPPPPMETAPPSSSADFESDDEA